VLAESVAEPVMVGWALSVPVTVPSLLFWDRACLRLPTLYARVSLQRFSSR
jgi:hypothetical protein